MLRSIRHTVRAAREAGIWVGVCGEMAGDPVNAVLLVGMGVDELSMASYDLPRVKAAIRSVRLSDVERIVGAVLEESTAEGVKRVLHHGVDPLLPGFLAGRVVEC